MLNPVVLVVAAPGAETDALLEHVTQHGWRAVVRESAVEALACAAELRPDVVIIEDRPELASSLHEAQDHALIVLLTDRNIDAAESFDVVLPLDAPRASLLTQARPLRRLVSLRERSRAALLERERGKQAEVERLLEVSLESQHTAEKALATLANTTELLERTGALANVGGWQVNLETMKLSWTLETFRIAEIEPPVEPPLEDGINLFAPEARPAISAAVEAAIEQGIPYDLELPLITAKGRRRWVHAQGFAEQRDGKSVRLFGTFQDITLRRQAAQALVESEARTRQLLAATNIGLWDWDLVTDEVYFSPEWKGLIGHTDADLENRLEEWEIRLHPEEREATLAKVRACAAGENEGTLDIQFRMRHNDGSWVWIRSRGELELNEHGQPVRLTGSHHDVTLARELQEKSQVLASRLQRAQRLEAVGRLAGGVAHDFNNLLSVILGHSSLAMEALDVRHPAYEDLVEIRGAAERSAGLTRQLLAFARRQTVQPRAIELNGQVTGMVSMLTRLVGEDTQLQWRAGAEAVVVFLDPSQLDQILTNLVVNARDSMDGNGHIQISVDERTVVAEEAAHRGVHPGRFATLTVRDWGVGIPAAHLDQIFEPFFTSKRLGKGTGLGLATVDGAVRQNGGFVEVASELGVGTTFHVYLPSHQGPAQDEVAERPRETVTCQATVLVVDDEPTIQRLAVKLLQRAGYRVLGAGSPARGLEIVKEQAVDLLVTDVIMPNINGRVLAERSIEISPDLKVLFMSGYTSDVMARHEVIPADVHFLQKPFSNVDLLDAVARALAASTVR